MLSMHTIALVTTHPSPVLTTHECTAWLHLPVFLEGKAIPTTRTVSSHRMQAVLQLQSLRSPTPPMSQPPFDLGTWVIPHAPFPYLFSSEHEMSLLPVTPTYPAVLVARHTPTHPLRHTHAPTHPLCHTHAPAHPHLQVTRPPVFWVSEKRSGGCLYITDTWQSLDHVPLALCSRPLCATSRCPLCAPTLPFSHRDPPSPLTYSPYSACAPLRLQRPALEMDKRQDVVVVRVQTGERQAGYTVPVYTISVTVFTCHLHHRCLLALWQGFPRLWYLHWPSATHPRHLVHLVVLGCHSQCPKSPHLSPNPS